MKLSKAIRKIAAIGSGAVMLGATVMGAVAADLSNYPAPFLTDGELDAILVVGSGGTDPAGLASDILGVVDISNSLQVRMTTPVAGAAEVVTVTGESILIQGTADDLNYAEGLDDVDEILKKADLPILLADGTVTDESEDEDYDYDLQIELSDDVVTFAALDEDDYEINTDLASNEIPVLHIDMVSTDAYEIVVDFDKVLNATELDDSEDIVICGKTWTFDPDMEAGDTELVFYASEVTQVLAVGESVTIGDDTIELIGANTDEDEATIKINDKAYQVEKGDTVAGDYYIKEIFMQTVPAATASIEIFVGADKIIIDENGGAIEVDGEDLDGVEAAINSGDVDAIDVITFTVTPSDMEEDESKYLEIGEDFVDPLFGTFKISFVSVSPALDAASKDYIELKRSGDELEITFTNRDGEEYSINPYEGNYPLANITEQEDWFSLDTSAEYYNIDEKDVIILQEGSAGNEVTKIYEIYDIDKSDDEVIFKDLSTGDKMTVGITEQVGDADAYVFSNVTAANDLLNNTDITGMIALCPTSIACMYNATGKNTVNVDNMLYTENGVNITIDAVVATAGGITIAEDADNIDESSDVTAVTDIAVIISSSDDNDIDIKTLSGTGLVDVDDKDNEITYALTELGTYMILEKEDNSYLKLWVPEEENDYGVYVTELASTTTTTAATGAVTITPMSVGTSKLDTEVTDVTAQNVIIVGGPCVNSAAADALGLDYPTCGIASTIPENSAIIKLIQTNGNYALVVAGWSADDTRRASRVVAQPDVYTLSGTEMTVSGTSMTDISVSSAE